MNGSSGLAVSVYILTVSSGGPTRLFTRSVLNTNNLVTVGLSVMDSLTPSQPRGRFFLHPKTNLDMYEMTNNRPVTVDFLRLS